ncbi:kelch repeat-containing protein [Longirhabdus pacifica]|uniref:kelch repeat-containing protein n=1 Tax=Longirhabdus pacifica TaxID=2305227 RepID=UPI00100900AD|nr:kelch repeat-containing protein [Longirhabdus pacifica]
MSRKKVLQMTLTAALLITPVMQVNAEQLAAEAVSGEQALEEMSVEESTHMELESEQQIGEELESAWQTMKAMPLPRHGFGTAVVDGKVYVIGGTKGYLGKAKGDVQVYDPSTDSWTTAAPMMTPRKNFAIAELNGEIYTFGGGGTQAVQTVEIYNVATDTWRSAAPMPKASYNSKVVTLNDKLYLLNAQRRNHFFYEYDPQTDVWTSKKSAYNWTIGRVSLFLFNDEIYAIGGLTSGSYTHNKPIVTHIPPIYHRTVKKYNMEEDKWEVVPEMKMLKGRYDVDTVEVDGKLLLVDAKAPDHSAELYDPEQQQWFTVETLPEAEPLGRTESIVDHTDIVNVDGQVYVINKNFTKHYTFDYKIPGAPRNFEKVLGIDDITLNWNPVMGAETYSIYRSDSPDGPFTSIAESVYSTVYSYSIPNEDLYTPLYYVVTAENEYGESKHSNAIDYVPNMPINLSAETGEDLALISWESVDQREGITYNIYSRFDEEWIEIGTGIEENYFLHENLTNERSYYYKVQAVNSSGSSPMTDYVGVRTLGWEIFPGPRIPLTVKEVDDKVEISWYYPGDAELNYSLRRFSSFNDEDIIDFPVTKESFIIDDNEKESGEIYNYFLIGHDDNGLFKLDTKVYSIFVE